mgnify:CR=1 FL=1
MAQSSKTLYVGLDVHKESIALWTCPGFVDTEVMGHCTGAPKG